jgi:hypothetical protein
MEETTITNVVDVNRKNTLVSSFVVNVNQYRPTEKYLQNGKLLLKANIPKIIFIDETIFDEFKDFINENTKIIPFDKKNWYFNEYKEQITDLDINTTHTDKDTLEYFFTMCNKTEWIKSAIELNLFNTEHFIWVDFGIRHIFKYENDETFIQKIERLNEPVYEKVRAGSIWDTNLYYYHADIYKDINWYFAGGVFGGHQKFLLDFVEKTKEMCIRVIKEKNKLMWEVNIWYLVYLENSYLFDFYKCDHNPSLVDNY